MGEGGREVGRTESIMYSSFLVRTLWPTLCMCVRVCVCALVRAYTICTFVWECVHVCVYRCMRVLVCRCVCWCVYICPMYVCMSVCTYVCTATQNALSHPLNISQIKVTTQTWDTHVWPTISLQYCSHNSDLGRSPKNDDDD